MNINKLHLNNTLNKYILTYDNKFYIKGFQLKSFIPRGQGASCPRHRLQRVAAVRLHWLIPPLSVRPPSQDNPGEERERERGLRKAVVALPHLLSSPFRFGPDRRKQWVGESSPYLQGSSVSTSPPCLLLSPTHPPDKQVKWTISN